MDDRGDDGPRSGRSRSSGDEAVFVLARVGGTGGRRPLTTGIALSAVMGVLVGAAWLGGSGASPAPAAAAAPEVMPDVAAARAAAAARSRRAPIDDPRNVLVLHGRAWGGYVIVHGDVLTTDAKVVLVSVRDEMDIIVGARTIDMANGSTAFRLGASDRFQLAFDLDDFAVSRAVYVEARAFDRLGRQIAADRQSIDPPVDPRFRQAEPAD